MVIKATDVVSPDSGWGNSGKQQMGPGYTVVEVVVYGWSTGK